MASKQNKVHNKIGSMTRITASSSDCTYFGTCSYLCVVVFTTGPVTVTCLLYRENCTDIIMGLNIKSERARPGMTVTCNQSNGG